VRPKHTVPDWQNGRGDMKYSIGKHYSGKRAGIETKPTPRQGQSSAALTVIEMEK